MEKIHITPINDLKEHIESAECHCKPEIEYHNDCLLVIHNAYDKRETLEKAQRQNLEHLKTLYVNDKITKEDIQSLLSEAINDEEYEVAVSIRDFLKTLQNKIMTEKEKAEELINSYKHYVHGYVGSSMLTNYEYPDQILTQAKKCALITTDEVLTELIKISLKQECTLHKLLLAVIFIRDCSLQSNC